MHHRCVFSKAAPPLVPVRAAAAATASFLFLSFFLFVFLNELQHPSSVFFLRPCLFLCRPALLPMGLFLHLIEYLVLRMLLFWFLVLLLFVVVYH